MLFDRWRAAIRHLVDHEAQLFSAVVGVGALKVFSTLIAVLTIIILARVLGPADFGAYSFALSGVGMVASEHVGMSRFRGRRLQKLLVDLVDRVFFAKGVPSGLLRDEILAEGRREVRVFVEPDRGRPVLELGRGSLPAVAAALRREVQAGEGSRLPDCCVRPTCRLISGMAT